MTPSPEQPESKDCQCGHAFSSHYGGNRCANCYCARYVADTTIDKSRQLEDWERMFNEHLPNAQYGVPAVNKDVVRLIVAHIRDQETNHWRKTVRMAIKRKVEVDEKVKTLTAEVARLTQALAAQSGKESEG